MAQAASNTVVAAVPTESAAIDRDHLARMTFGDRALEREVLQLFDRQADLLLARMRDCEPPAAASLAHTLAGSAAGIGATAVAQAAAAVERATGADARGVALRALAGAIAQARAEIAQLLRG